MKNAIITSGIAPMFTEPSACSELADEVLHGMEVEVEILPEPNDNWAYVRTSYNYSGFVEKKNLGGSEDVNANKAYQTYLDEKKFTVISNTADVLSAPKVQGYNIICLPKGAAVAKTGYSSEGWCGVILASGREGFIRERLLTEHKDSFVLTDGDDLRKNLVNTAMSYMKTQYRWGGKTPLGIDCSGLTSMAYLLNGVKIYRDADIREGFAMKPVPDLTFHDGWYLDGAIKPGDLIFFPGHVAMYIDSGRYIHSSPINEGVGINSLNPIDDSYHADLAGKITKIGSIFI